MKKLLLATAFIGGSLAVGGAAHAAITVDQAGWGPAGCVGATSCVVNGVTVSALGNATQAAEIGSVTQNPAQLSQSSNGGSTGLGINFVSYAGTPPGQANNLEIQYSETMRFDFGGGVTLDELSIVFLYSPPNIPTDPQEISFITGDPSGVETTYTLQVIDNTTFTWDGGGTVTRGALADGKWTFTGAFDADIITYVELTAPKDPVTGNDRSDFSFHSLTATSVPEPATLGLLGLGLLGLAAAARRARR